VGRQGKAFACPARRKESSATNACRRGALFGKGDLRRACRTTGGASGSVEIGEAMRGKGKGYSAPEGSGSPKAMFA